ncbi:hypothetical protein, partial [Dermatophilus congolensis]|uniref:hypothetical protein n=1 Tax=Dermatophilus congolensis TaxID=1863 RepID=UPI001AB02E00
MRIRTDDAATRVEFTFYDLPGEARWFQWVRFYIACLIGIPLTSFTLWLLGSLFTHGPWLTITATLTGATITIITTTASIISTVLVVAVTTDAATTATTNPPTTTNASKTPLT